MNIKHNIKHRHHHIVLTIIFLLVSFISAKGQSFTLQGRVTDKDTNPIQLVSVSVPSQSKVTFTSRKGQFELHLRSADSIAVYFSMIGYKNKLRVLKKPKGNQTLQITLYDNENLLDEVTVKSIKKQTGQSQDIKKDELQHIVSSSGNAVEELIQTQSGVSTHNELSAQYNVRGGTFDENSVYINDIEIYRPFLVRSGQQEGLSVIHPEMVSVISFSTGGFECKYGDKMSSALDIKYRHPKRFKADFSAGLLGAGAFVGFNQKKLAWSQGIRYKTNKYLLGTLDTKGEYDPSHLDYQSYLTYKPNKQWEINLLANISHNVYRFLPHDRKTSFGTVTDAKTFKVYFDGKEKDLFKTYFGALDIKRKLYKGAISLMASAFYTSEQENYDIQSQYWLEDSHAGNNLGVGTFFEHARNHLSAKVQSVKLMYEHHTEKHHIQIAATLKHEQISQRFKEYEMRDSSGYSIPRHGDDLFLYYSLNSENTLNSDRLESYIQDTYRFTSSDKETYYTLNYGLRMGHWSFNKETLVSPRIALGITPKFDHNMTIRLATGLYYQTPFIKELRDTVNDNLCVTSIRLNQEIKSQRSIHVIGGVDYIFHWLNRPFKFSGEVYFKHLDRLIPYAVNNVKITYYGDKQAHGYAAGVDFKLYGQFVPESDSWFSFSLMKTRMHVGQISMPLPTDQRYAFNLYFTDYFPGSKRFRMSLKAALIDGLPFYPPHHDLQEYGFRSPAYKRVDIGMHYLLYKNDETHKFAAIKNIWLGLDCFNLLGINNVSGYYWIADVTGQQFAVPNYLTGRMINATLKIKL